jgi:hypothetical protein
MGTAVDTRSSYRHLFLATAVGVAAGLVAIVAGGLGLFVIVVTVAGSGQAAPKGSRLVTAAVTLVVIVAVLLLWTTPASLELTRS